MRMPDRSSSRRLRTRREASCRVRRRAKSARTRCRARARKERESWRRPCATLENADRRIVALAHRCRRSHAMEMKRMSGGNLRAAGYDERMRKLVVELTSGTLEYTGVPSEVWRRFSTASSPWSYYRDNIDEEYPARRTR